MALRCCYNPKLSGVMRAAETETWQHDDIESARAQKHIPMTGTENHTLLRVPTATHSSARTTTT